MNRLNNMKIGKRALSLLLASIMVLSVMGGAFDSVLSFINTSVSAVDVKSADTTYGDLTFVVPDSIYLKPNGNTFQFFLNNTSSGSVDGTYSTSGKIYYTYSGTATISYEFLNTSMTSVSTSGISLSSSSITSNSSITINASSTAPAANTSYYIRWKIAYPGGVAYAYTYVYAPFTTPVATGNLGRYKSSYDRRASIDNITSWVSGIHNIENGSSYRKHTNEITAVNGRYDKTPMLNDGVTSKSLGRNDNAGTDFYCYTSGIGYFGAGDNDNNGHSEGAYGFMAVNNYIGVLYVDSSRFSNIGNVPNFRAGLDIHEYWCKDKCSGAQLGYGITIVSDTSDKPITKDNQSSYNYTNCYYETETFSGTRYAGIRKEKTDLYNLTVLNTPTTTTTYDVRGRAYIKANNSSYESWSNAHTRFKVVPTNKVTLRAAVYNATKQFAKLGVNGMSGGKITSKYFDNSSSNNTWGTFADAYYNAVIGLTKVDGSCDASTLANNLNNAINGLKTKVIINKNTTDSAYSGPDGTYYVKIASNGVVSNSVTVSSVLKSDGSSVSLTASRTGYEFVGWNTSSGATSGTSNITTGFNQTWYPIFKRIMSTLEVDTNGGRYTGNLLYFPMGQSASNVSGSMTANSSYETDSDIQVSGHVSGNASATYDEQTIMTSITVYLHADRKYKFTAEATDNVTEFFLMYEGKDDRYINLGTSNSSKTITKEFTCDSTSWSGSNKTIATSGLYQLRIDQNSKTKVGDYTIKNIRIEEVTQSTDYDSKMMNPCGYTRYIIDPQRTGYTFSGWELSGGTGTSYNSINHLFTFSSVKNDTVKMKAKWTPITYTISYSGNGNTGGSTTSSTHTYDTAKTLTANGFSKEYTITYDYNDGFLKEDIVREESYSKTTNGSTKFTYSFNGWKWNGKSYTNSQSVNNLVTTSQTLSFVAQWKSTPKSLENPTRPGYTFLGWYTAASGGTLACAKNGTYTAYSNVTLYAHWQANSSSVTLKYNNETTTDGVITKNGTTSTTATYGSNMSAPIVVPERTGYIFKGYYGLDGKKQFYYADGTSAHKWNITNSTYTLTPKWEAITYTVKYYGGGATTNNIADQPFTFDVGQNLSNGSGMERKFTVTFNNNDKGQLKTPGLTDRYTADTYSTEQNVSSVFKGWKRTDNDDGNGDWFVTSGTSKKTDYSISDWAYNLTSVNKKEVEMTAQWEDQKAYMPSAPTRYGYTFGGWYENAECTGTKRDPGDEFTPTANKTFYAKWTANVYTTTYVYNLANSYTGYTFKMGSDGTLTINGSSGSTINPLLYIPFKPVKGHSYKVEIYNVSGTTGAGNNRFVVEPVKADKTNLSKRKNVETTKTNTSNVWSFTDDELNATEYIKVWLYVDTPSAAANFSCKVKITDTTTNEVINVCQHKDTYGASYGTLPTASKPGYTFKGWYPYENSGNKVESTSVNCFNTDRTLYAQWTANTYVVKYNGNGGSTTSGSTSYNSSNYTYDVYKNLEDSKFKKSVRITYNFNTGSSAAYLINDDGTYDSASTSTYVDSSRECLGWANTEELANAGTISYSKTQSVVNLATSGTKNVYAVWESTSTITLPKVFRPGYTFEGWYTDAGCTTPAENTAGKNYAGDPYTYSSATTLYAKWERIKIDNKVIAYDSVNDITAELIDQNKVYDGDIQTYGDIYSVRYDDPVIYIGTNNTVGTTGIAYTEQKLGGQNTTISSYDDSSKVVLSGSGLDTKLTFTPEKLTSTMTVFFECKYRDFDVGPYQYVIQSISFVPANSIFLEDDVFVAKDTFLDAGEVNEGSGWVNVTGTKTNPGADVDNYLYLHDKVQGYNKDYSYNSSAEFSNGTALKTTVSPEDLLSQAVEYRFYGTGFDLYSDCGPNTSDLVIKVWKMDSSTSTEGSLVQTVTVDTSIDDESVLTVGDDNNSKLVRQIPVYHYMSSAGYYLVQVRAYYDPDTSTLPEEYGYIDGLRIYNRIDDESGYNLSEKDAKFYNILQYTRNDNQPNYSEFEAKFASVDASPVNEIYLAPASGGELSGTVFNLDGFKTSNNGKVMISLRAAAGTPTVKISNGTSDKAIEITLTHATEMYYDITEVVGNGDIYIVQTSDTGYAAICNLKITNSTGVQLATASVDLAAASARFEEIETLEVIEYVPTDTRAPHEEQPDIIIPGQEEDIEVEYTVSFKTNGHGNNVADQKVIEGNKAVAPASPVCEGYVFGGWYTEAGCKNAFDFNTPVTSDIILYAKWTEKKTQEDDPVSVNISIVNYVKTLSVDYHSKVTLSTNISAPEGYEIVWSNGQKGNTCTIDKVEKDLKIYAKVVNKKNSTDVIGQTEIEEIKVKDTSFFAKLIAIFKEIFKALPEYKDNKKIK